MKGYFECELTISLYDLLAGLPILEEWIDLDGSDHDKFHTLQL
jgi:hypothetical protein